MSKYIININKNLEKYINGGRGRDAHPRGDQTLLYVKVVLAPSQ